MKNSKKRSSEQKRPKISRPTFLQREFWGFQQEIIGFEKPPSTRPLRGQISGGNARDFFLRNARDLSLNK